MRWAQDQHDSYICKWVSLTPESVYQSAYWNRFIRPVMIPVSKVKQYRDYKI